MSPNLRAFALVTFFVTVSLSAAETSGERILVLRNGQMLRGTVTQVGDHFLVTNGKNSQVRIPATKVEITCDNLQEAYLHRRRKVRLDTARGQVQLADWSLRHGMRRQAADHLLLALSLNPKEPGLERLQRRWNAGAISSGRVARGPRIPQRSPSRRNEKNPSLKQLPDGALEQFTHKVQPLLMNYCGRNGCHGPKADSDFRLLRPLFGGQITRRYTQRNLDSTLQLVNRQRPDSSRILVAPKGPHGNLRRAVFNDRTSRQYEQLATWVWGVTGKDKSASVPPTITRQDPVLTQPGQVVPARHVPTNREQARIDALLDKFVGDLPEAQEERSAPQLLPTDLLTKQKKLPRKFVPSDRFDAAIFNRKYGTAQP